MRESLRDGFCRRDAEAQRSRCAMGISHGDAGARRGADAMVEPQRRGGAKKKKSLRDGRLSVEREKRVSLIFVHPGKYFFSNVLRNYFPG